MIFAAFILGLTGSLHCVGMCGPIAMLIHGKTKNQYLLNRLAYHTGRTLTYMVMGIAIGMLGKIFRLGGIQSVLSIVGGALIAGMILLPRISFFASFSPASKLVMKVKSALGKHLRSHHLYSTFLTGLFNGLLPCGLVYSALALALVQSTVQESVLVMALFGLGTVPALLVFTYSANLIQKILPFSVSKLQRASLLLVAAIMIWRGVMFSWPEVLPGDTTTCHTQEVVSAR